jgi:hypothetical protein
MIKFARGGDGWKHREIMYFIETKARYPHTHFGQFFMIPTKLWGEGYLDSISIFKKQYLVLQYISTLLTNTIILRNNNFFTWDKKSAEVIYPFIPNLQLLCRTTTEIQRQGGQNWYANSLPSSLYCTLLLYGSKSPRYSYVGSCYSTICLWNQCWAFKTIFKGLNLFLCTLILIKTFTKV